MLVAQNSSGEVLSLTSSWLREELLKLRNRGESFRCPSCKQQVLLKIGTEKIPHFAHVKKTVCDSFSEGESLYHMKGKLQLFDWFVGQSYTPTLEPYFSHLKQRPDLYVEINKKQYMIEYQCATIEKDLFQRRNQNYLSHGYKPLWILGGKRLKRKSQNRFSLPSFDCQFVNQIHNKPFLLFYCSETEQFLFLQNIIPLEGNTVYANLVIKSRNEYSIKDAISPINIENSFDAEWLRMKRQWRLTSTSYRSPFTKSLLHYLYQRRIYPSLLPSEVGIPLPSLYWIQTPLIVWQAWILLEFIEKLEVSTLFSFYEVYEFFKRKSREENFMIRDLPFMKNSHYSFAIKEYLDRLATLGVISYESKSTFIKKRYVHIPKTIEEALLLDREQMQHLRKKNKGL